MCSMARKAASAIFRADVEDEDEDNLELEVTTTSSSPTGSSAKKTGNTKTIENHDTSPPLTIPPKESVVNSNMQLSDLNISAFSKMSIDTMASSMATTSSMGCSMTSITTPSAASSLNEDEDGLPVITLEEVKNHFHPEDAWTVIYDRVYNVTSFLAEVNFDGKFLTEKFEID